MLKNVIELFYFIFVIMFPSPSLSSSPLPLSSIYLLYYLYLILLFVLGFFVLVYPSSWCLCSVSTTCRLFHCSKGKGKGILFYFGGQTGKDCLLTWADAVKVADRRDRTRNLSLRKRCTNHCTTEPHTLE